MKVVWPNFGKRKKDWKAVTCEKVLWLQDLEMMEKEQSRHKLLIEKATVFLGEMADVIFDQFDY